MREAFRFFRKKEDTIYRRFVVCVTGRRDEKSGDSHTIINRIYHLCAQDSEHATGRAISEYMKENNGAYILLCRHLEVTYPPGQD